MSENQFWFKEKVFKQDAFLCFTGKLRKEIVVIVLRTLYSLTCLESLIPYHIKLILKNLSAAKLCESALKRMGDFINQRAQKGKDSGKLSGCTEVSNTLID